MSKPAKFEDVARAAIGSNLFAADGTRGKVLEADGYCDCDVCIFDKRRCSYALKLPCDGSNRADGKDVVVVRF